MAYPDSAPYVKPNQTYTATPPPDPWHYCDTAEEPARKAGWDLYLSGYRPYLRFRRVGVDYVEIEGALIANAVPPANAITFTLPVGYRPTHSAPGAYIGGQPLIAANGDVYASSAAAGTIALFEHRFTIS